MVNITWSDQKTENLKLKSAQAILIIKNCYNSIKSLPENKMASKERFEINNHCLCQVQLQNGDILFGYQNDVLEHLKLKIFQEMTSRLGFTEFISFDI